MALKLCSGIATPTPTPTPSPATPTPSTSTPSSTAVASGGGTPVGAIVGGVVGGVCALALIGLLAFLLLRRRKRSQREAEIANSSAYPPAPPMMQQMGPQQHYMGGPPPPGGPYSPTHSYPSPPFGHSTHNSMGFAGVPVGGFGGPQSDYSNDPLQQQHSGPQFYSPSPSTRPEHASMVYSETTTAVPELASPGQPYTMGPEWRSEVGGSVSFSPFPFLSFRFFLWNLSSTSRRGKVKEKKKRG